jgi:hypothetical protein
MIGAIAAAVEGTIRGGVPGSIIANILIGGSHKSIWNAINIISFLTHTVNWHLSPPANLQIFFEQATFFSQGEWLPKEQVLRKFGFLKAEEE